MNICNYFIEQAKLNPNKVAIIHNNQTITFGNLLNNVITTANYYRQKGIKKGDRVLVFVPMSINLYTHVLAIFYMGATAVFLDEWVSIKRLTVCCEIANCKAFVAPNYLKCIAFFVKKLRQIPIWLSSKVNKSSFLNNTNCIENTLLTDTALITFTTGSTGIPKAAKRTHGFLNEQFKALVSELKPSVNDIDMATLPIVLLINLGTGITSVIPSFKANKVNSQLLYETILKYNVNRIIASPFIVKSLASFLIKSNNKTSIHKIFVGGAPVFPSEAELYEKAFPNTKINIVYGSTEAEPISLISSSELLEQKNSVYTNGLPVGKIHSSIKIKIIPIISDVIKIQTNQDLEVFSLPNNTIGEIIVSGPHVLTEYYNNQEALFRNKIFVEDTCWHRTGDSGMLQSNNTVLLTGRCSGVFYKNEVLISQFIYESFLLDKLNTVGTVLNINSKAIVITETINTSLIESALKEHHLVYDTVIYQKHIPRDPRHNSKIEYEKLKKVISIN